MEAKRLLEMEKRGLDMSDEQKMRLAEARKRGLLPPRTRGVGEELGRQAGLTVRTAVTGVTALPVMLADGINNGIDLAMEAAGIDYRQGSAAAGIQEFMDKIGLPRPETGKERFSDTVGQFVAGGSAQVKGAQVLGKFADDAVSRMGQTLAAKPGVQTASAVTGGTASALTAEATDNPYANLIATLTASMLPGLKQSTAATTRGTIRGGESGRQKMQQNIADFEGAGTNPTVGQASGNKAVQGAEGYLAQAPGSAGVMFREGTKRADDISQNLTQRANDLAPGANPTKGGRRIVAGVENFVENFKAKAGNLYTKVDNQVNPTTRVLMNNTLDYLKTKTALQSDLPEVASLFESPLLKKLGITLDESTLSKSGKSNRGVPYPVLKELRTQVGNKLDNPMLLDDVSSKDLRALYASLSKDMELAAKQLDGPGPFKSGKGPLESAASRANNYWKAGRARIDELENVVNKSGGMDKIFNAFIKGTENFSEMGKTVMKSLDLQQKKMLSAAFLQRMGRATSGNQGVAGDTFSFETFMTNWDKTRNSHQTMFGYLGKQYADDMDQLGRVAENIKFGSRAVANPSGSAKAGANIGVGTTIALGTLGGLAGVPGAFTLAFGAVAGIAGNNAAARLMNNPKFVHWAAQTTKVGGISPASINALAQVAEKTQDHEMALFAAALSDQETTQN